MINRFVIHDSFTEEFRRPFGAAKTGQKVCLFIKTDNSDGTRVKLNIYANDNAYHLNMTPCENGFFAEFTMPDKPMVLFYDFTLEKDYVSVHYAPKKGSSGGIGKLYKNLQKDKYQLTVFDKHFKTPDRFKGALMYQIFPDRFAKSGENFESGKNFHLNKGRKLRIHKDFSEDVCYLPEESEKDYAPNDYFGGDLKGITSKLEYLSNLGVEVIYLNPIFEADSNHRYNTSDYLSIDPFLGTNEDFKTLCEQATKYGINIILDGVFSHTGSDSTYFKGALNGEDNPYYSWYKFESFPDKYACWWGFKTLPEVNEHDPNWQNFIIKDENSVIKTWLNRGASGFRLDVADELPDDVITLMRKSVKEVNSENLLLGEVWEDATTKKSYGYNRGYALGNGLDSVMNYPLRTAVIEYFKDEISAKVLVDFLLMQAQNYPKEMHYCLMNLVSSHDVERIRTLLALDIDTSELTRDEQAQVKVSAEGEARAKKLMPLVFSLIMTIPGMPSIYYGDECIMHGLKDPFNRRPYANPDDKLIAHISQFGTIRKESIFKTGGFTACVLPGDIPAIIRYEFSEDSRLAVLLINKNACEKRVCVDLHSLKSGVSLNDREAFKSIKNALAVEMLTGIKTEVKDGLLEVDLPAYSSALYFIK